VKTDANGEWKLDSPPNEAVISTQKGEFDPPPPQMEIMKIELETVLEATVIHQYIHELIAYVCDDIYRNIGRIANGKTREVLSNSLPRLIQEFALKLGAVTISSMNQRLMYFVIKQQG
jgi:hypothetical protein